MYTAVVTIEKHLQNQLQKCSAKQDRESVITPEHYMVESYFEKKIVYMSVHRNKSLENTLVPTLMALMKRKKSRIPCTLALLRVLANTCLLDFNSVLCCLSQ